MALTIDWRIIEDLIIDKIEKMPKDAKIIGVHHQPCQMYDSMGIYSKKFRKVPDGIVPPTRYLEVKTKYDKRKERVVIYKMKLRRR